MAYFKTCKKLFLFIYFFVGMVSSYASQEIDSSVDSSFIMKKVNMPKGLDISGYLQIQWQMAQTKGQNAEFAGGPFAKNSDNRFQIRRARLKFGYNYGIASALLHIDANERGIKIKEVYLGLKTKSNVLNFTAGISARPFGYELGHSSSLRPTPERSLVVQALFPDERDIGAKIALTGKKGSIWNNFLLEGGVFTDNSINNLSNSHKDFIGRVRFNKLLGKLQLAIGASTYVGGVYNTQNEAFFFDSKKKFFILTENTEGTISKRNYYGADMQLTYNWVGGATSILGEFVAGRQPASLDSNTSPMGAVLTPVFNRKFFGYYIYFIQDIAKSGVSAVVRLDYFDPNRLISGNDIGFQNSYTSPTDLAYTTLGLGAVYNINSVFRVLAYYDFVWNEKSSNLYSDIASNNYSGHVKNNMLTICMQCKF